MLYQPSFILPVLVCSTLIPGNMAAPQGQPHQDAADTQLESGQPWVQDINQPMAQQSLTQELNKLNSSSDILSREKRQFGIFGQQINHSPAAELWMWARLGNLEMVSLTIEVAGVPVDAIDEDHGNWTALMWASRFGHYDCVHYLLVMGAFVNHQNVHGDCALLWATGAGWTNIVELLLIYGADPNLAEWVNGFTPVSVAAAMNREAELRLMDQYSWIDLDHVDIMNRTPINLACMTGMANMVLLLGYHGNINVQDVAGMSPAHWGVNLVDTSTLQAVLLLCPDLSLMDNRGNTPLMVAELVGNTAGAQLIEDHIANPNTGCWIGDDEFPAMSYIFFDCKQMQCMCGGYWRQTTVRDPECIKSQVNVVAIQEVESISHNASEHQGFTTQASLGYAPYMNHPNDHHAGPGHYNQLP